MITQCPHCKKQQEIPDPYRNREIKCLHCKQTFPAKDWVEPYQMLTQCQWCKKVMRTPETNRNKVLVCSHCMSEFRAELYVPEQRPPEPEVIREPPPPAICDVIRFFAWLILGISILAAVPTFGGSLGGIAVTITMLWFAQMLQRLAAAEHYLRILAVKAAEGGCATRK
jgi:hypothetical protein